MRFDTDAVRDAWDHAADAYAGGQAAGRDVYRYEFFGPVQVAACGDVRGLRVLDVGCGSGYLARELASRGARVAGLDLSPRMIEHAAATQLPPAIEYHVGDAAALPAPLAPASFDLAVSCVALQDMPEPARAIRGAYAALRPGGRFVCSIVHPCGDTPVRRWERDAVGAKRWLCIDRYFDRGPIEYPWNGWAYAFTTTGLHVPLEDWFAWFLAAGFALRGFHEPCPDADVLHRHPDLEAAARVPHFAIFDLARQA